jgi:CheY-specific phosphatase CheX
VIDVTEGADSFAEVALKTFQACGATTGELVTEDAFEVRERETVVLLGVVGAWRGAVAFLFDPGAVEATATAMAGEPIEGDDLIFEALLEAVNIVAGRGAARLAEDAGRAVWLTPPLLAQGESMDVRLQNFAGKIYRFGLGDGAGGLLFSAAPEMGGIL